MSSDAKSYRWVDTVPGELLDGRPIGPGEYADLSRDDLKDARIKELVEAGKLIPVEEQKAK